MADAIVRLENVTKRFPKAKQAALDNVSAEFPTGLVTGLVGPDGAGKTTLMRLLAGLLETTSGRLRVNDLDPIKDGVRLREFVGYMPQRFGLYEDLSVQENLDLHADLRGVMGSDRKKAFDRLLALTDLAPFTSRWPAGFLEA